ncbi:sensor histidine kinase [Marinobacterium zhoushanense]|uniref:sensor histidine kinase n=1 Tax=Marinobacterium zhoushanense TaxID=1679163 RepID=UPI001669E9BF|nr:ATP-binding protein [Marinobacterium zhoushanense]
MALIAAYLLTNYLIHSEHVRMMRENANTSLRETALLEASTVDHRLQAVTQMAAVYAAMTAEALDSDFEPGPDERQRYTFSPEGAWYTSSDTGGAALFYSSIATIGVAQQQKAWRLAQLDPLMKQVVDGSDLIAQAYFNSYDSMNRIYPYFDVLEQYPVDIDIPTYNFYYEADAEHNPERGVVWTDVYVDPAGQGWMVSAIAPVYARQSSFLEGVVGLDVQVSAVIDQILSLKLPWESYAMLLDSGGTIMAMPQSAELDWGLKELTSHSYDQAIRQDMFKPERFNIFKRPDTEPLAAQLVSPEGIVTLSLNGRSKLATWATIPNTGWRLLIIVDEAELYADTHAVKQRFDVVGYAMLALLILFYLLFLGFLYRKAVRMSGAISRPLAELESRMLAIGEGYYQQPRTGYVIREVQNISDGLVVMGQELESAQNSLMQLNRELEQRVELRTADLADANRALIEEQRTQSRLIDQLHVAQSQLVQSEKMASLGQLSAGVAHEINNPLSFVSSNIQCLQEYVSALMEIHQAYDDLLTEPQLQSRIRQLKQRYRVALIAEEIPEILSDTVEGTRRIKVIVDNLLNFSHISNTEWQAANLNQCVDATLVIARNELKQKAKVVKDFAELPEIQCVPSQINQVILTLLINAAHAIEGKGEIRIQTCVYGDGVKIRVKDNGCGIARDKLSRIFDPFFTTKEVGKGTGLGLSVAYGIVRAHQGCITVESEPGEGSCFEVWLPLIPSIKERPEEYDGALGNTR